MQDVDTITAVCKHYIDKRVLVRTLMGGTKAMIKAGEIFTPIHPAEKRDPYETRLKGTTLFNGFERAIKSMVGKMFSKNIILNTDVPEQIQEYCLDIDGEGRNLTTFCMDAFENAMIDGISFVHVDFTKVNSSDGQKPFLSDQLAQGARPNAILYRADQIIGFKRFTQNGRKMLKEIRIREFITEDDGEWGEKTFEQIKVLRIGEYQIYRAEISDIKVKTWVLYDEGEISLDYIPVVPMYVNRVGYMLAEPPLQTLAELNLEHWVSSSEQRKALMFERFAMVVLTGVQPEVEIEIGPDRLIRLTDPESKYGKLESSGKGIEAGRLDLEAIERKMQAASMTIRVQDSKGIVTATEASIDSDADNASLVSVANSVQDAVNNILQIFADYNMLPTGGTVVLNKEFGQKKSKLSVTDFLSLLMQGVVDEKVIFTELQRRGDLNDELDFEEVSTRARESMLRLLGGENSLSGNERTKLAITNNNGTLDDDNQL